MSDDIHEVYAVRYGHHGGRNASMNFIGGDPHQASQDLAFYVWAIVGKHGTIVVDTGFDEAMAKKRERSILKPVGEALKSIGIQPDRVDHVIISHLHYDHCGNYDVFPRARYHLQDCEMDYATGRCMCEQKFKLPFEADDVTAMVHKVFDGRVTFHDGDGEIVPGVSVHHIGGHSKGLQAVRVKTKRGNVVLASDSTHLYAHLHERRVFPITYNANDAVKGYARLEALASSRNHVIPGHDPRVLELYAPPSDALKGWAVRLDAEPVKA
jgi:glyoxylase-like metal-dependent hydrolase (beta-lactamase superfamily II)